MTKPGSGKVKRETDATAFDKGVPRAICVELHNKFLRLWLKGTKQSVNVPYEEIFTRAAIKQASAR